MKQYTFFFHETECVSIKHIFRVFSRSWDSAFQHLIDEIYNQPFTLESVEIRDVEQNVVEFVESFGDSIMILSY